MKQKMITSIFLFFLFFIGFISLLNVNAQPVVFNQIKFNEYNGVNGEKIQVRELAQNVNELRVNNTSVRTNLDITTETNFEGRTKLKTMLKNGQIREIMIMPDVASEKALDALKIHVCSVNNNCTIQLKSIGNNTKEKIQYEMNAKKDSRIIGIFPLNMQLRAEVDAQTGDTKVYKPWWAFMATT
jgi:hypothetical protein